METVTKVCNSVVEHACYICYEENLEALRTDMNELKTISIDVKGRVEKEERRKGMRLETVAWWLSEVERMEAEVDKLINPAAAAASGTDQEEAQNWLGRCYSSNCWNSYKMGKQVAQKLKAVALLKEKGNFPSVATPPEPFETVKDCLQGEGPGTIGVCGPGGVGKTTLLTKISQDFLSSSRQFHFVIWVVVSQDINLEKIQAEIGREIGLLEREWEKKSLEQKAEEVSRALSQRRFLLLMDDIWEQVDLAQVGVPLPDRENGSKLVFTTRSMEVCEQMAAEEKIELRSLEQTRSWELFRDNVGDGTLIIHPRIPQLGETIANMCKGLPLALKTIGRAMAGKKTLREWHESVKLLTKSTSELSGTDEVLALLKFCFDSLPSEKVKECFLYCTLFPEDYIINKHNLIDNWIGEGFFGESRGGNEARKEGYEVVAILVEACLLEEEGKDVKMHDLIREMALWVASDCGKLKEKYLVEAGSKLTEAPDLGKWKAARRMSIMANHIRSLDKAPRCPHLFTLFLGSNHLRLIVDGFFQFMPSLIALDLSENRELSELPTGISDIGSLQYLNLSRTAIKELPRELKKLVKLKCLNLEHTYELHPIHLEVISCFKNLHVLRMIHSASDRVVGDGIRTGGYDNFVEEFKSLENLSILTITIRTEYALGIFVRNEKLRACIQALSLQQWKFLKSLNLSFMEDLHCMSDLEFVDCASLNELTINESLIIKGSRFTSLRKVSVVSCSKLEDLSWLALAPNLEFLAVSRCSNMEEIIRQGKFGEGNLDVFAKLEVLRLDSLPNLKTIYPAALPFPCLKEVMVDGCQMLKKLPLNSDNARGHKIVIQGWEDWWRKLEWEDESAQNAFRHSFRACMY